MAKGQAIRDDPANLNPAGRFWIYHTSARRKLDAIAWAMTYKLKERREKRA